jgi:acyl-coenzyme A thioesterase PaaI-like protein
MSMEKKSERNNSGKILPASKSCFVCGKENNKGLKTRWSVFKNTVRSTFIPDIWFAGYDDIVHGGILSAVLDEAIIWASYAVMGRFGITAEISIRFVKQLKVGHNCFIEGWFIEDKGRIWVAGSQIINNNEEIIAKASGKVIPLSIEESERFENKLKF